MGLSKAGRVREIFQGLLIRRGGVCSGLAAFIISRISENPLLYDIRKQ